MNSQLNSSFGVAIHPSVRCVIGLYGSQTDDDLDEAFSALVDDLQDNANYKEVINYNLDADVADRVQFLVASQSLKPHDNQVTRITLMDLDTSSLSHLSKQTFDHPDGEITGLTAVPAKPDWFVSTYSSCSSERPDIRMGARVWRLPPVDSTSTDHPDGDFSASGPDLVRIDLNPGGAKLEFVTTLPLGKYHGIRRIAAHPSPKCADLACLTGPAVDGPSVYTNAGRLVLLQAPSDSSSGEFRETASVQLCLPSSPSRLFTSHLRTKPPAHWAKLLAAGGGALPSLPVSSQPNAVRWSPAGTDRLGVAFDAGVLVYDVRSMQSCFWLEAAHWPCVRDLDFNPHRPEAMVTGGDDGYIRLWDLRYLQARSQANAVSTSSPPVWSTATEPLYSAQSHSHWVWCVRYHPTHDQLILSAGSDCRVCLHSLTTYSSDAAAAHLNVGGGRAEARSPSCSNGASDGDHRSVYSDESEEEAVIPKELIPDGLIGRLEQHEDSVYAVDWSPVDTWYFASVSYDGNLLISQVPEKVKMNILL